MDFLLIHDGISGDIDNNSGSIVSIWSSLTELFQILQILLFVYYYYCH
jgi:hypothetical protein